MPKQILFDAQARNALLRGINQVADAVGATLGPRAGTVLLSRAGLGPLAPPLITKDGVTVARSIALPDPVENEAAKLLQEVAARTDAEAGDGTTATTVLARELFRSGLKLVAADHDPQALERGIRAAVVVAVAALKSQAQPLQQSDLDSLRAIARIASNGDIALADVIAEAVHRAGVEGSYTFEQSPGPETSLTMAEGFVFKRGFLHPIFCTDPARRTSVFEGANLFLTDRRILDAKDFRPVLDVYLAQASTVPLIIVAEDIDQGARQMLVSSHPSAGGGITTCPLRLPPGDDRREQLEDLAIFTGAKVCSKDRGDSFKAVTFDDFGSADKVIVTSHQTTVVGGHGAALRLATRRDELRTRMADSAVPEFERLQAERRLAVLGGQVAVLRLGSAVQSKLLEKRDRAQDALNATVGALKEGIVPGGGVALLGCISAVGAALDCLAGDERAGAQLLGEALTAPLRQIAANCGQKSPEMVLARVLAGPPGGAPGSAFGYNAALDRYEGLLAAGIVDPCRVVRLALENAAELAGLLLTTAALVVDLPEEQGTGHRAQSSGGGR